MRKNTLKIAALAAAAGTILQFGGCLNWNYLWRAGLMYGAMEFALDNDAVFDLFEAGEPTATTAE